MKYFKAYHTYIILYIRMLILLKSGFNKKLTTVPFYNQQWVSHTSYIIQSFLVISGKKRHSTDGLFESGLQQGPHIVLGPPTTIPSTGGPIEFLTFCIWLIAWFYIVYLFLYSQFVLQTGS